MTHGKSKAEINRGQKLLILISLGYGKTQGVPHKSKSIAELGGFYSQIDLGIVNIPGHSEGLCALKITNDSGKYVLLFSDGGYAQKS